MADEMTSASSRPDICADSCCAVPRPAPRAVLWLQGVTLVWMLLECGVALYAAQAAHSVVLLAFGSDSLVELLSAAVVLLAFSPRLRISPDRAGRWAGVLLFFLAGVIALTALVALLRNSEVETSGLGMTITVAALIVMPALAWSKRRLARTTGNRALAADAVQSATCAWLAAGTLAGLGINTLFHLRWIDSVAALVVLPLLLIEGRRAVRGESCGCC
jgi:divalent metal cation (Fe/Co/Zn/Cd) transporter